MTYYKNMISYKTIKSYIIIISVAVPFFIWLGTHSLINYSTDLHSILSASDIFVYLTLPWEYNLPILIILVYMTHKQCDYLEIPAIKVRNISKEKLYDNQFLIILQNSLIVCIYTFLCAILFGSLALDFAVNWSDNTSFFSAQTGQTVDISFAKTFINSSVTLVLNYIFINGVFLILHKLTKKPIILTLLLSLIYLMSAKGVRGYFHFFSYSFYNIISEIDALTRNFLQIFIIVLIFILGRFLCKFGDSK